MTNEELAKVKAKLPISASTIARNAPALGAVEQPQRKRSAGAALDRQPKGQHRSERDVGVVVEIIACRHRLFDDDNSVAGLKPIRDAIARSLGVDDGDKRLRWCYGQCRTDGEEGTIVRISALCLPGVRNCHMRE